MLQLVMFYFILIDGIFGCHNFKFSKFKFRLHSCLKYFNSRYSGRNMSAKHLGGNFPIFGTFIFDSVLQYPRICRYVYKLQMIRIKLNNFRVLAGFRFSHPRSNIQ